ncbi:5480_t:CDS:1, partial [Racocetra persica]
CDNKEEKTGIKKKVEKKGLKERNEWGRRAGKKEKNGKEKNVKKKK